MTSAFDVMGFLVGVARFEPAGLLLKTAYIRAFFGYVLHFVLHIYFLGLIKAEK